MWSAQRNHLSCNNTNSFQWHRFRLPIPAMLASILAGINIVPRWVGVLATSMLFVVCFAMAFSWVSRLCADVLYCSTCICNDLEYSGIVTHWYLATKSSQVSVFQQQTLQLWLVRLQVDPHKIFLIQSALLRAALNASFARSTRSVDCWHCK